MNNIAVVGLGYVGLPLALLAREKGWRVTGIDIDPRKRKQIEEGTVPDLEPAYAWALKKNPLPVYGDFSAIQDANIVIVCVPTPVDHEHVPDLGPVKDSMRGIAKSLHPHQLIILESTVHPGTSEEVAIPILEQESGLTAGKDFGFAHCPERINPGDAHWTLEKIPRVVGATTPQAKTQAAEFYRSVLAAPVQEMETIREAEAVKMVENCFRDVNIAFVNELAMSFNKLGIDVMHVIEGASTKPFSFMPHFPGCGVGGHCIPVDPYYLIRYAKQNGFSHDILSLARSINEHMPTFAIELLEQSLGERNQALSSSTVALLGLSYKSNISDMRESPALEIRELLSERGVTIQSFDPFALEQSTVSSLEEALHGADAALIATAHNEFKALTPDTFLANQVRVVVDGRNCLQKEAFLEAGITYRGIGR